METGAVIPAPPSWQHGAGPQAGPQAGSQAGAALQGSAWPRHGERNSMKEGLRQLLPPPKQLLHPGAAARPDRAITRHRVRDMMGISTANERARMGRDQDV
jgi:hypothetical protein